jgi:hypothetical protein
MMALFCSGENPNISISGSSAPRTTQSKVGWLRSSSFSKKERLVFEDLFKPRGCFVATVFIFGPGSPPGIAPGYGVVMARNHNFAPYAIEFIAAGKDDRRLTLDDCRGSVALMEMAGFA